MKPVGRAVPASRLGAWRRQSIVGFTDGYLAPGDASVCLLDTSSLRSVTGSVAEMSGQTLPLILSQLLQQRLGFLQVFGVESFRKPVIDLR